MKITRRFKIPYDRGIYEALRFYQREAARVWNETMEEANQYAQMWNKWLSEGELKANRKQEYALHSQTVQAIVEKYVEAREGTWERRRNGDRKAKYPYRRKTFFCIPFKEAGYEVRGNEILLKFSHDKPVLTGMLQSPKKARAMLEREKLPREHGTLSIPNPVGKEIEGSTYLEVVWDRGYWVHYVVEVPEETRDLPQKAAGCDMGEIHVAAVATEDKALVVSGRAIRAVKQWRAKALAELSKKMSRCKRGSRQWKKYRRAKIRVMVKTRNQLRDWMHKATTKVVEFLVAEQVTCLVVGDVTGIEKNTVQDERKKAKTTGVRRQQLSTWEYGRFREYLKYKAKLRGIRTELVDESYTSQDCPFCGGRHQAEGRTFRCPETGRILHRDVNGAQNIARKKYPMEVRDVQIRHWQPVWLRKYRRMDGVVGSDSALQARGSAV